MSFAELVDEQNKNPIVIPRTRIYSLETPQASAPNVSGDLSSSSSINDFSSGENVVKRRLTKEDVAGSSEGMNALINEMDGSESNMESSQKRSRSFSSQEPDLKFETKPNKTPRNHILSSASNSSGSDK